MASRARTTGRALGAALLDVAALGGLVCLVLVALAVFFHITLIMFKTDSMSPTIPAGSLAVVRQTPAASVAVGDVVTVDRPDALPVTHRVMSISPGPSPEERVLRLKGDANQHEDADPYTVSTVRSVLASAPRLAYVVVWFSNPRVLAALTLGASLLVTWAFWPRRARGPDVEDASANWQVSTVGEETARATGS